MKGTPANPMSRQEAADKALDLVEPSLGATPIGSRFDTVSGFDVADRAALLLDLRSSNKGGSNPPVYRRPIFRSLMEDRDIPRAQLVYASLKDMIRKGAVRPGQRMREIEIAEAQGVSRTPVREAMHRLVAEGLLEATSARGIAVTELSKQQVLELYGLREFLEGASARFAAQHASLPEMHALRELLEHIHTIPAENPALHAQLNKRFHAQIAESAHNTYLSRALSQLSDSLMLVPGTTFQAKGRVGAVRDEHLAILAAIEIRDAEGAERAAREHIRKAGEVRLQMLFGQR